MTIIRTIAERTRHDIRRIKRGRYEILAIDPPSGAGRHDRNPLEPGGRTQCDSGG